jgi:mRNA-degrading endonuclease RelE of RelBE toxin-antitoxin system
MTRYGVFWSPHADLSLKSLPPHVREYLWNEAGKLADNPRPIGCKWMPNIGYWRMRCGNYRVAYRIADKPEYRVFISEVADRKHIYERLRRLK